MLARHKTPKATQWPPLPPEPLWLLIATSPSPSPRWPRTAQLLPEALKNRQRSEPQRSRQALAELPQSLRARRK